MFVQPRDSPEDTPVPALELEPADEPLANVDDLLARMMAERESAAKAWSDPGCDTAVLDRLQDGGPAGTIDLSVDDMMRERSRARGAAGEAAGEAAAIPSEPAELQLGLDVDLEARMAERTGQRRSARARFLSRQE